MVRKVDVKAEVFVIDDDEAVLDSLRLLVASEGWPVRCFGNAESFLEALANSLEPSCIVADVRLPGMSGLDLQADLNRRGLGTPLILITGHGQIDMAVRAVKAGAHDFLEKPFDPNRLVAGIRSAIERASSDRADQRTIEDLKERVALLSERQRQVMDLAVVGFSNKEIAQQMGITPRTVESYRAWVMEKTGAANLAELVRLAMQLEQSGQDQRTDPQSKPAG